MKQKILIREWDKVETISYLVVRTIKEILDDGKKSEMYSIRINICHIVHHEILHVNKYEPEPSPPELPDETKCVDTTTCAPIPNYDEVVSKQWDKLVDKPSKQTYMSNSKVP